jgi:predicted DNA-binding WGR domain protein
MRPEFIELFFQEGTSDKVYQVSLSCPDERFSDTDSWKVTFSYGRRGELLKDGVKGTGLSYQAAKAVYDKLVKEKTKKGYRPEAPADSAPVVFRKSTKAEVVKAIRAAEAHPLFSIAQDVVDGAVRI